MPGRPRLRTLAAGGFFVVYLASQITLATSFLWSDRWLWQNLGWQMYSGRSPHPDFHIVDETGATIPLEEIQENRGVGIVVGGKLDSARFVPPHVCDNVPEARAVVVANPWSGETRLHECER